MILMFLALKQKEMLCNFTVLLFEEIKKRLAGSPTTFGYEIEYLPAHPLDLDQMERLYKFLPEHGYKKKNSSFISDSGLSITFEPGGQIEYGSPPLGKNDLDLFNNLLKQISDTNAHILKTLKIEYIATGYMPGRARAPLCLKSKRYISLHQRMTQAGTKGREMMKGTAAIHLHVGPDSIDKIPAIYRALCRLATGSEFGMSKERRDIWNNTDPGRCEMPLIDLNMTYDAHQLLRTIVHHALSAQDLYQDVPLYELNGISFEYFKNHLTTIFTDVRLNLKGPTIELRTLDSTPANKMVAKWNRFISFLDSCV